jgi:hypothetical protein
MFGERVHSFDGRFFRDGVPRVDGRQRVRPGGDVRRRPDMSGQYRDAGWRCVHDGQQRLHGGSMFE